MNESSRLAPSPGLLALPVTGTIDAKKADRARAIAFNSTGRRLPLTFIFTWEKEAPSFQALAREFGPDQPVYGISPPGGEWPDDYPTTVDAWADFCLRALRDVQPTGPYVLGGWSFGGVVALTLAEKLLAEGEQVLRVVMLDSRLPKQQPHQVRTLGHEFVHYLDEALELPTADRLAYCRIQLRRLWDRETKRLETRCRRMLGRTAPDVSPPPAAAKPPLMRAIWTAYLKYQPFHSRVPVSLFWTQESCERVGESTLGWGQYLRGPFDSQPTPGHHRTLFDSPHDKTLAESLRARLSCLDPHGLSATDCADRSIKPASLSPPDRESGQP